MGITVQDLLGNLVYELHSSIHYRIIKITCVTLLYGIYLCLIPTVVHVMVTNGLQSRSRKWLLAFTISAFALSTMYWILSVVFTSLLVDSFNNSVAACFGRDKASVCLIHEVAASVGKLPAAVLLSMFDDILLINYIIADAVIVWRAWVLCSDQRRVVLMIPVVMLGINAVIYLMTIVLRAIELISDNDSLQKHNILIHTINATQVTHLTFSLLINIYATSVIALKAWKYRKLLMESGIGIRTPTQAIRILALLIESGMIYILISVTSLVLLTIFLHIGLEAISSIFLPAGVQLVGIYPIAVVLLVEKNRSLSSTYSSFGTIVASDVRGGQRSQTGLGPMSFAPEPMLASGGLVDVATKSRNTDIHVTLDSKLEPGDLGMGARISEDSDPSEEHAIF